MKKVMLFYFITITFLNSQSFHIPGGGEYHLEKGHQCISDEQRLAILSSIKENKQKFNIINNNKSMMPVYDWPIAQNPAFDYNATEAISNYVDHDVNFPNQLEDYNCDEHTYDTGSGYNHQGIDMFLWPFDHNQVDDEQTWAVAAAAGTIVAKVDGNFDANCNFNSLQSNYVILEHADGSDTWYLHLKNGSVTTKSIGSSVTSGEYLGVIASSGNSTGPHLHFECYSPSDILQDPYAGPCNNMNTTTLWNNQRPYWDPTINTLLVHDAAPVFQACPNLDITNIVSSLQHGQTGTFAAYYHDQLITSTTNYSIKRPDGTTWANWNHTSNNNYRASYWYWTAAIPSSEPTGNWTFEATLDGFTYIRSFEVTGDCPTSYSSPNGNALTGIQNVSADFETDGIIESTQIITGTGINVDYDSGTYICMDPGFEVVAGALFQAFIDGCGGTQ